MSVATSNEGLDSTRSWIVAVACFFVQVLTFGLTEASGLLFVATIPRYSTTREKASLPYAITYCLRSAVGPIVSYIGRKFGIRLVTLFGCVLSAISVASCFFATNILELTLLWGVMFGFSLGLETSLLNVILNEHFEKQLVKANGLNISGASLGTLLLSPIIEHCVKTYGLSGTFLIISGLMLNSLPAVFVMIFNKPPKVKYATTYDKRQDFKDEAVVVDVSNNIPKNKKIKLSIVSDKPSEITQVYDLNNPKDEGNDTSIQNTNTPVLQKILQIRTIKNNNSLMSHKNSDIIPRFWKFKTYSIDSIINSNDLIKQNLKGNKEDSKYSTYLPTVLHASTMSETTSLNSSTIHSRYGMPDTCNIQTNNSNSKWQLYQLFSEPIYVIILIGSGTYYFIITTFLTIIVDYATDLGISITYSTYIVMWIAVCDIGGYLFQSWIIELRHLSQSQFTSVSFLCLCLASVAMVWCSHFVVLLMLIGVFEVAQCGVIILAAPLVAEYMHADLHATGIASLTILSSPMTLAISPLIGYFRDGGGSYAGVFYVLSVSSFLCSVLFLSIPKLQKHRQNNQNAVT